MIADVSATRGGIVVRRFESGDRAGIARLNERLERASVPYVAYPEGAEQHGQRLITERLLVAVDDTEVRGAVWLKEHPFRAGGTDRIMGWPKYLIAESLIDARFAAVPRILLRECLRTQPLLMGLGFGGLGSPMARLLAAHRWVGTTVPFYFRPLRPGRVVRELAPARRSRARRFVAMAAHRSGATSLAWQAYAAARGTRPGRAPGVVADAVESFGAWADDIWARCADSFGLMTVRSAAMLASLYPADMPGIRRLRVRRSGEDLGWAVVLIHDFGRSPDRAFGALRIGILVDLLAPAANARDVATVAVRALADDGVDVIFTNQSHPTWIDAVRRAGLVEGPVNFAFYRSPGVDALIARDHAGNASMHVNRGDGDGPIWWQR